MKDRAIYLVPALAVLALGIASVAPSAPETRQEPPRSTLAGTDVVGVHVGPGCLQPERIYIGSFISARKLTDPELVNEMKAMVEAGMTPEEAATAMSEAEPIFKAFVYQDVLLYVCADQDSVFIQFPPKKEK